MYACMYGSVVKQTGMIVDLVLYLNLNMISLNEINYENNHKIINL